MKRIANIFLLILTTLLLISCGEVTEQQARQALDKHLKNKYGEEFEISYVMGRRAIRDKEFYQAEIYPKKYNGTEKEYDKYYRANGTVVLKNILSIEKIGFVGDTYGIVKINESTENFYKNKLEELFGENILFVPDTYFNRVMKDYSFENILRVRDEEGIPLVIKGGIYIFGRVENDEDREWYRKQIYEFIQFMKETGTFEYVDLDIIIVDERALISNSKKLLENFPKNLSENDRKKKKREMMKAGDKEFADMTQKEILNKINSINKAEYRERFFGGLLYVKVYSQKYVKVQKLDFREEKEYDTIDDIKFDWETW